MKKFFATVAMVAVLSSVTLLYANPQTEKTAPKAKSKILVTYFSSPETDGVDASSGASRLIADGKLYGATEYVAKTIHEITGGTLFQIKTTQTYPTRSHNELVDYAEKEADSKTYPQMATKIQNISDYDVIFIGYPNWHFGMPMVIHSLLNEYDFSGKTIIPFCTHGGSGFSQSIEIITRLEKKAKVLRGPAIARDQVSTSRSVLAKWLQENGIIH